MSSRQSAGPEYLSTATVAKVYDFPSTAAVRQFLRRHGVPTEHLGRSVRVLRASMEEAMKRSRRARQRGKA